MLGQIPVSDVLEAARAVGAIAVPMQDEAIGVPRTLIRCKNGWHAARLLLELAKKDARRAPIVEAALALRARTPDDRAYVRAVQLLGQSQPFVREKGEIFFGPARTLRRGGDCDDHVRIVYGMLVAGGIPARLALFYKKGENPSHVLVQAELEGRWVWVETTLAAALDEPPLDAAKRLGKVRGDVDAPEVATMMGEPLDSFVVTPGNAYCFRVEVLADGFDVEQAFEGLGFEPPVAAYDDARDLPLDWPDDDSRRAGDGSARVAWVTARYENAPKPIALHPEGAPYVVTHAFRAAERTIGEPAPVEASTVPVGPYHPAPPIVLTRHLSRGFFVGFLGMCQRQNLDPEATLAVLNYESALKPWSVGYEHHADGTRTPIAFGLNQQTNLPGVGWHASPTAYLALSAEEQLPFVERFFAPYRGAGLDTIERIYQANFLPATLGGGSAPDRILLREGGTGYNGKEADFYEQNKGFDREEKGFITVGDLGLAARHAASSDYFAEALGRLRAEDPGDPPVNVGAAFVGLAFAGALGGLAYWWLT